MYYKLDENKKVVPSSLKEWANFFENEKNHSRVGLDNINGKRISTVFIGLCHNYNPRSRIPITFETMVFDNNDRSIYQERYSTWQEAEEGHKKAVEWVKNGCVEDE